jgi:hypothetical protein
LSLELCDLPGARPAMRGSAEAERGRGDKDAHIGTPPRLTRKLRRLKALGVKRLRLLTAASIWRRGDGSMTMHGGDRKFPGFIPYSCIGGSCPTHRHPQLIKVRGIFRCALESRRAEWPLGRFPLP